MTKPHVVFLAIGFPPASKSSTYRHRASANALIEAGFEVTVLNASRDAWERETGIDETLLEGVNRDIKIIELPLFREDLETDIRKFSEERVLDFNSWRDKLFAQDYEFFPERVFGHWLPTLCQAIDEIQSTHRIDLILASSGPYVVLGAAQHGFDAYSIPYALDYRDGWSLDVLTGEQAFTESSREGVIENRILENSLSTSFVNDAIRDAYAKRYPTYAPTMHVFRNGYVASDLKGYVPHRLTRNPQDPLRFGYVGTLNISNNDVEKILEAWVKAKKTSSELAEATLTIAGHLAAGSARGSSSKHQLIESYRKFGVTYAGAVKRSELATTYSQFDIALFTAVGGRFVTSGKIYELMATGLPILSAHDPELEAGNVLKNYPLWIPAKSFDVESVSEAILNSVQILESTTDDAISQCQSYAQQYERTSTSLRFAKNLLNLLTGCTT